MIVGAHTSVRVGVDAVLCTCNACSAHLRCTLSWRTRLHASACFVLVPSGTVLMFFWGTDVLLVLV